MANSALKCGHLTVKSDMNLSKEVSNINQPLLRLEYIKMEHFETDSTFQISKKGASKSNQRKESAPLILCQILKLSTTARVKPITSSPQQKHRGESARDLKNQQVKGRRRKIGLYASEKKLALKSVRRQEKKPPVIHELGLEEETVKIKTSAETVIAASRGNPAFGDGTNSQSDSFIGLGLSEQLADVLSDKGISFPTVIQRLAIPKILNKDNIICAAQTGSGKTLAYMAPIIQSLKHEETEGFMRRPSRPRACIILPARELALQTLKVSKSLAHYVSFKSEVIVPGRRQKWIKENISDNVDIIIGTPKEVLKYKEKEVLHSKRWRSPYHGRRICLNVAGYGYLSTLYSLRHCGALSVKDTNKKGALAVDTRRLSFSDVQFLVLDEADTLFDPSFYDMTKRVVRSIMLKDRLGDYYRTPQCTLTMATFPRQNILNAVEEDIPNIKIVTAGLHRVLPHVTHKFVRTLPRLKPATLLKQLNILVTMQKRKVMVFTNSTKTCAWLSHFLKENSVHHIALHGAIRKDDRGDAWEAMMDSAYRVVICTDLASRGLDTVDVSAVVNYDCPMTVVDYVHRAGRTGRIGSQYNHQPEVYSMITGFNEATLAAKIKMAAAKNESINDIEIRKEKPTKIIQK